MPTFRRNILSPSSGLKSNSFPYPCISFVQFHFLIDDDDDDDDDDLLGLGAV
jgi:hypothetical protein